MCATESIIADSIDHFPAAPRNVSQVVEVSLITVGYIL